MYKLIYNIYREKNKKEKRKVKKLAVKTQIRTLVDLERDYTKVLEEVKLLTELKELLRKDILNQFEEEFGHVTYTWISPETGGELQRIFAKIVKFDDLAIKQVLPVKVWDKIKKEVVDKEKYASAVKLGLIDESQLASAVIIEEQERLNHRGGK